jgi:tellurite methyltransferase
MKADIERWNRKYAEAEADSAPEVEPLLLDYRYLLNGKGTALDVACGQGQNTVYLASLGFEVIGIDGSLVGLRHCQRALELSGLKAGLIAADLEQFPLPHNHFDVVLVMRFLDRALIPSLKETLKPDGLLIYATYNKNVLHRRPTLNTCFVLELGELVDLFADFKLIATNDKRGLAQETTYLIARRVHGDRASR